MENEPELIRDQMQETRTALTEKLDSLQQKVADTVESITTPVTETVQSVKDAVTDTVATVKGTVTGTVESVKETVAGTVESVKETFDLSRQIERHPWPIMFGSVAAGFALGRILPSPSKVAHAVASTSEAVASGMAQAAHGRNGGHAKPEPEPKEESSSEPGLFSGLANAFQGELDKLKGLGVTVGVGLLRDLMAQSLQGEVGKHVSEWMDGLTEKLRSHSSTTSQATSEPARSSPPPEANGGEKRSDDQWAPPGVANTFQETRPRW